MSSLESELFFGDTSSDEFATPWSELVDWETEEGAAKGNETARNHMDAYELLLDEDAAFWSELSHPADRLLHVDKPGELSTDLDSTHRNTSEDSNKNNDEDTDGNMKNHIKRIDRICERFPLRSAEEPLVAFSTELRQLQQRPEESLRMYYNRLRTMMRRVGARDHPPEEQQPEQHQHQPGQQPQQEQQLLYGTIALNQRESLLLDTIMYAFTKGMSDAKLRQEAALFLASCPRPTLAALYITAEGAHIWKRVLEVNGDATEEEDYDCFGEDREMMRAMQKYIYGRMTDETEIKAFRTLLARKCGVVDFAWMEDRLRTKEHDSTARNEEDWDIGLPFRGKV